MREDDFARPRPVVGCYQPIVVTITNSLRFPPRTALLITAHMSRLLAAPSRVRAHPERRALHHLFRPHIKNKTKNAENQRIVAAMKPMQAPNAISFI
jgi:hypothetical protein